MKSWHFSILTKVRPLCERKNYFVLGNSSIFSDGTVYEMVVTEKAFSRCDVANRSIAAESIKWNLPRNIFIAFLRNVNLWNLSRFRRGGRMPKKVLKGKCGRSHFTSNHAHTHIRVTMAQKLKRERRDSLRLSLHLLWFHVFREGWRWLKNTQCSTSFALSEATSSWQDTQSRSSPSLW